MMMDDAGRALRIVLLVLGLTMGGFLLITFISQPPVVDATPDSTTTLSNISFSRDGGLVRLTYTPTGDETRVTISTYWAGTYINSANPAAVWDNPREPVTFVDYEGGRSIAEYYNIIIQRGDTATFYRVNNPY